MKQVTDIQILKGIESLYDLNNDLNDGTDIKAVSFYLTAGIVTKYELSQLRNVISSLLFKYSISHIADEILEEVNDFLNSCMENPSHCFSLVYSRLKRLEKIPA
ncbi:MAG: hypothetical protein ABF695_12405 [Liquorilactobacillus ghanensis]|uniref:hypothetical protein n=1 Tax=Liquorilactobacillus ghanensis TaxID=399370 RepID=UPI0039E9AD1F